MNDGIFIMKLRDDTIIEGGGGGGGGGASGITKAPEVYEAGGS